MKTRLSLIALGAACATAAGGSFLTARAETLHPAFHQHTAKHATSYNQTVTCLGHVADETGNARAGFGNGTLQYRANGSGTIQVLGGSWCTTENDNFTSGTFNWALSSQWTSSRSYISVTRCTAGQTPFATFAACKVADGR